MLKKQDKEEFQSFRSEQLEACSCHQLGGAHLGREGGHFELCEVCHPSGGAEWATEPNNLEIWKRSRLQRDTGCCRHTGTLSIKTVNEERVEKEGQKGTPQYPGH